MRVALSFGDDSMDRISGRLNLAAHAVASFAAALDRLPPRMPQLWNGDQA